MPPRKPILSLGQLKALLGQTTNQSVEPFDDDGPRHGERRVTISLPRLPWMERRPSTWWGMSEVEFRRELADRRRVAE
jgi:hypothetical protein